MAASKQSWIHFSTKMGASKGARNAAYRPLFEVILLQGFCYSTGLKASPNLHTGVLSKPKLFDVRGGADDIYTVRQYILAHTNENEVEAQERPLTLVEEASTSPSHLRVHYNLLPDGSLEVMRHRRLGAGVIRSRTKSASSITSTQAVKELWRRGVFKLVAGSVVRCYNGAKTLILTTFLPAGYPSSVSPEYLTYQKWNLIQDLSTNLRGILAIQAILEGMGVGRAGSTAAAAALQWITRDGASMIGGLAFTAVSAKHFGTNVKTWRLFADVLCDVGITLDMFAPLFPRHFLAIICLASVFKSICGVAAGAVNAAIQEHWAISNNIADVGAKNGAQHTVVSLMGLSLGVWLTKHVNIGNFSAWGLFFSLTFLHLFANFAAMRTLSLRTLNPSRLNVLVEEYMKQLEVRQEEVVGTGGPIIKPRTLGLSEVAKKEQLLWIPHYLHWPWGDRLRIQSGAQLQDMADEADDLLWLTTLFRQETAMISASVAYQTLGPKYDAVVNIALREDCTTEGLAKAYFQACLILHRLRYSADEIPQGKDPFLRKLYLRRVVEESLKVTQAEFNDFANALHAQGWDLGRVSLGPQNWACKWGSLLET